MSEKLSCKIPRKGGSSSSFQDNGIALQSPGIASQPPDIFQLLELGLIARMVDFV
jgi:hypothetical protein